MKNKSLTFKKFRKINSERCEKYIHPINSWSPCEWATALGGETGELLNWVKKLRRLDDIKPYNKKKAEFFLKEIAKEASDVFAYLDLITLALGINLEDAIVQKFNEVSDKYKCPIKL